MLLTVDSLCTEVDDGDEFKEKGLQGPKRFPCRIVSTVAGGGPEIAYFWLNQFPGCCGLVVSTDSWMEPSWRGTKWGKDFHALKSLVAKHYGYTAMIMTTQLRNIPEVVGAAKARWHFCHFFRNKRTDNDIGVAFKDLT